MSNRKLYSRLFLSSVIPWMFNYFPEKEAEKQETVYSKEKSSGLDSFAYRGEMKYYYFDPNC